MKTVCQIDACTGCLACLELCPTKAIHIEDSLASYNAVIDETLCIHCDACHKGCQNNNEITYQKPYLWKQGWAADNDIRKASSSGGVATEIARSFVRGGGVVCSCVFSAWMSMNLAYVTVYFVLRLTSKTRKKQRIEC